MSGHARRRGGKPNRGGGRFNRGGGGGGRGHGKHKGGHGGGGGGGQGRKGFDLDLDLDDLMDGPVLEERGSGGGGRPQSGGGKGVLQLTGQPSAHGRGGSGQTRGGSGRGSGRGSKVKVQMQHLHMTSENQELVRDMLKSLHGDDHSIPSDNEYDELDTRADDHYWQTERPLFVDSAHAYALKPQKRSALSFVQDGAVASSGEGMGTDFNPAAMNKLKRCGFSSELCQEALQVCDGDVGVSLEYLLTELRSLDLMTYSADLDAVDTLEDVRQLRQDEKVALESIYEERFEERVVNRVWLLHLDLPDLRELINFRPTPADAESRLKREVCRFYKKGHCRFGDKCRQLHSLETEKRTQQDLQGPLADTLFSLEFRFPDGNRYPQEAPLVAFSAAIDRLPGSARLNIARHLMVEAEQLAQQHLPAVFSLASLLEDRDLLQSLLDSPPPNLLHSQPPSLPTPTPAQSTSCHPTQEVPCRHGDSKGVGSLADPRDRQGVGMKERETSGRDRNGSGKGRGKGGSGRDRDGPDRDRDGPGRDRDGPGRDRDGPDRDRDGPGRDRDGPGRDRDGPGRDRDGPGRDRDGPGRDRDGPGRYRDGPGRDRDGPGRDRDGPGRDKDELGRDRGKQGKTGSNSVRQQQSTSAITLRQNRKLKEDFKKKPSMASYQRRLTERQKLPAWSMQDKLMEAIHNHQVLVVSGMTGCGKTTQVPQFILDDFLQSGEELCHIVCTQPRRISAIAVAQRVADERAEKLGESVGYQIRLESVQSQATRLLFCTTGIILRRLEGDPLLAEVTHIIVDEVHERSEDSDFLLMIVRDVLPQRPDLKVILMSATLNADLFSQYFGICPVLHIPGKTFPVEPYFLEDVIEMTGYVLEENSPFARAQRKPVKSGGGGGGQGGRGGKKKTTQSYADAIEESLMGLSFADWDEDDSPSDNKRDDLLNVKEMCARYPDYSKQTIKTMALMDLEKINCGLILKLLKWIVSADHQHRKGGAILVFLPGFAEIQQMLDELLASSEFGHRNKSKYKIVPLHSSLSSDEQNAVFAKPREGVTKIVIATNIAETSITIDDIVYVIDAGRMKEKRYDSTRSMESLETVWVSQANALQRRGRAGRVTSGVCFHLFTSHRFENHLREQPIPEIQRVPLEQLMLRIRMLEIFGSSDAREVLSQVIEPPSEEAMNNAMRRLVDVGALDEEENLTALGYHLGSLPVDVRIGKLMVLGAIFRCLDSALTIAASLSYKSPFVSPFGKKAEADEKRKEFAVGSSDYLTILNAYKQWLEVKKQNRQEEYEFCQENFLSIKTLQMLASLKQQYVELLSDIGFTRQGLRLRTVQRCARESRTDGIVEATGEETNSNTSNWKLISAILVGALYPNVVQVMTPETRYNPSTGGAVVKAPNPDELRFVTKSDGNVFVHPSSVNFQVRRYESPYLVYHEKVKTTKVYIRDCTMVSVYSLLLFAGGHISIDLDRGNLIVSVDDGWIRFRTSSSQVAELLRELRIEMDKLLDDKIRNPDLDLAACPRGSRIIPTIVKLITTQ